MAVVVEEEEDAWEDDDDEEDEEEEEEDEEAGESAAKTVGMRSSEGEASCVSERSACVQHAIGASSMKRHVRGVKESMMDYTHATTQQKVQGVKGTT
jgi:TATA-binding protein-associated factor Taf7